MKISEKVYIHIPANHKYSGSRDTGYGGAYGGYRGAGREDMGRGGRGGRGRGSGRGGGRGKF
jgi:hypothetical protein